MINEQDFVDLGKDCAQICEVLNTGTRGQHVDSLSLPVREAIEGLNK